MNNAKALDLNLNGDTFDGMKNDFNIVLQKTLTNMERKGSRIAEITLKMKMSLSNERVPDLTIVNYEAKRDVIMPKFEHKVSSVIQIKDEVTGSLNGNYELIWDGERGEYVMREIVDGQVSMYDDVDFDDDGGEGVYYQAALPSGEDE